MVMDEFMFSSVEAKLAKKADNLDIVCSIRHQTDLVRSGKGPKLAQLSVWFFPSILWTTSAINIFPILFLLSTIRNAKYSW